MRATWWMLATLIAAGCADGTTDDKATDTDPAVDTEVADVSWQDQDFDQRLAYMRDVVVPTMRPLFQEFDSALYADFACATCHGAGFAESGYDMPGGPPDLSFSKFPYHTSGDAREASYGVFMRDEVLPTMVDLLDEEPFELSTGEGFSCSGCHVIE